MGKNEINMEKVVKGDYLSRISYMKVISTSSSSSIVRNEDGLKWSIGNDILKQECISCSEFTEEVKVSRTELIDIFNNVGDKVFTVNFDKTPKSEDYLKLTRGEGNKILSFSEMEKLFKKVKGENRTLIGYMIKSENGFGRSNVVDLEVPKGEHNIRQVDHRTLNWLICNNKKYVVK